MYTTFSFESLDSQHFDQFIEQSIKAYAKDMHRFGEFADYASAEKAAATEVRGYLPNGQQTADQHIFAIKKGEANTLGYLWFIAKPPQADPNTSQAFLAYIWVDEACRQQKIGTYIMDFFEQTARQTYRAMGANLYVFQQNIPAVALYRKRGYTIVKSAGFYQATQPTRFYMHKEL